MKALVSGQAGVAVVLDNEVQFRPVEGDAYIGTSADVAMTFAGFPDVETVEVETLRALDQRLGQSFAKDRAKFLLFMLIDGTDDADDRREIADEIERLVTHYRVKGAVTSQLAKISLNGDGLEQAQLLAEELPKIAPFLVALYPGAVTTIDRAPIKLGKATKMLRRSGYKVPQSSHGVNIRKRHGSILLSPVATKHPDKFKKLLVMVVEQARTKLASDRQKGRRAHFGRLIYDTKEFDKVVDGARRMFAAELEQAQLEFAVPSRAVIATKIRAGGRAPRIAKVTTRKHGRKLGHAHPT